MRLLGYFINNCGRPDHVRLIIMLSNPSPPEKTGHSGKKSCHNTHARGTRRTSGLAAAWTI
jgi:hypothetical protein